MLKGGFCSLTFVADALTAAFGVHQAPCEALCVAAPGCAVPRMGRIPPFFTCVEGRGGTIMHLSRSIHELARSRRAAVLTPLIIALVAVLLWTLEHTDIVAFAAISIAALVLISGTFWATGPRDIKVTNAQSVFLSLGERVMVSIRSRAILK